MNELPEGKVRFVYVHPVSLPSPEANVVQTVETCLALAERGNEVFLVVPKLKAADAGEALERLGVEKHPRLFVVEEPAIRLSKSSGLQSVGVRAALLVFLHSLVERRRTVLFFRSLRDSRLARFLVLASRLLRVPLIYEAHKVYSEKRLDQGFGEGTLRRITRLEGLVLDRAHGVVATHPLLGEELRRSFRPKGPLLVAPNGVRFHPLPDVPKEYDAVYAGSLFEWKGVDLCLEAAARLEGCRLAIVGGNPERRLDLLRQLAREMGIDDRVTFFGQLPRREALSIVEHARVALVPLDAAFEEGERYTCPLKMLEAMMRGVPVIAADTPALRTFVEHDRSALLAPVGDGEAMARELRRLLDDEALAARIAAAGREIAERSSFRARAQRLEELALALLDDSR